VQFRGNVPNFAYDAWTAEVVPAPDAPWAPDPRLLGLGLAGLVYALVLVRRRVRRR